MESPDASLSVSRAPEINRLRTTVSDVISLSDAISAWADFSPDQMIHELANMLLGLIKPSWIYLTIEGENAGTIRAVASAETDRSELLAELQLELPQEDDWVLFSKIRGAHLGWIIAKFPKSTAVGAHERTLLEFAAQKLVLALESSARSVANRSSKSIPNETTALEKALREARSRLDTTLAAGEVGTWEFDVINDVVTSDRNLAHMFGVSPEIAEAGASIAEYIKAIHPDDVSSVEASIQKAIETSDRFQAEYRILGTDGLLRWVVARGTIDRDSEGRALRLPGVVVDITAQRDAEKELRATLLRWSLALESAELGAWNIDPNSRVLLSDERFRVIFTGSADPLSYDKAFDVVHPDDVERVERAVEAALDQENPLPFEEEYRVIHPDGNIVWVLSKGRANFEGTGANRSLNSFDGTISDISEWKQIEMERQQAEETLRELAAKLSEADRRKDEFLATLAHELRNPLAPIRTGLEVMRMAGENFSIIERVRTMMETQTQHLVRLIDDLLDLSRITSGRIELRKEVMDLGSAVQTAIAATQPAIEAAGHHFTVDFPAEPIHVDGDSARLSQVISNLLTNAARYTDPGGEISLTIEAQDREIILRVSDNGIGIESEMLTTIFEMFTQADRSQQRSQGGLGIGLTLVKRLTELHGGTVEARSQGKGRGSDFIIHLPLAASPPIQAGAASDRRSSSVKRKVLVVDDNEAAAETLGMALTMQGNEVRIVHDGSECLKEAAEFRPEIILMDVGMPRMNGLEATAHLRKQSWGKEIFIIALTGWGQESDRQKTREAGFDHHLVKPVEPTALADLFANLHR